MTQLRRLDRALLEAVDAIQPTRRALAVVFEAHAIGNQALEASAVAEAVAWTPELVQAIDKLTFLFPCLHEAQRQLMARK